MRRLKCLLVSSMALPDARLPILSATPSETQKCSCRSALANRMPLFILRLDGGNFRSTNSATNVRKVSQPCPCIATCCATNQMLLLTLEPKVVPKIPGDPCRYNTTTVLDGSFSMFLPRGLVRYPLTRSPSYVEGSGTEMQRNQSQLTKSCSCPTHNRVQRVTTSMTNATSTIPIDKTRMGLAMQRCGRQDTCRGCSL